MRTNVFSNVILAISVLYCTLVLGHVHVTYSQVILGDLSPAIFFYGVPATCIGLMLLTLRLNPERRANFSLVVLSTAIPLFLMEAYLAASPRPTGDEFRVTQKISAAAKLGVEFDARSKLEVVDELRASGLDVTLAFLPGAYISEEFDSPDASGRLLPLGGQANTATVLCNESGSYPIYEADERGFNNPRGVWSEAKLDLLLVGDSYAQGICVASEDNVAGRLREVRPRTLNLGMAVNGPLMMLATLKEYGGVFEPDVVLWLFYGGNDFSDLAEERRTPLLHYLEEGFSSGSSRQASGARRIDRAVHGAGD